MSRFAVLDPETGDWVEVTEDGIRMGLGLASADINVQWLTAAIVEVEEAHLDTDCLSDGCEHQDGEHPEYAIGCGDAAEIAAAYRSIAAGYLTAGQIRTALENDQ